MMKLGRFCFAILLVLLAALDLRGATAIRLGRFDVDASPPIGSPLAYDRTTGVTTPLSCRGIVLTGSDKPIVLCAIDWIGISNDGHREFCERLAHAAGTTADRVAVHVLHQHDAPWCDFSVDALVAEHGIGDVRFDSAFARDVIERAAEAVGRAARETLEVTHVGHASAKIEQVASNRRILGPDGKVQHMRFTATLDPAIRAFPEGVIDPELKLIGFWNGDQPLAVLTYYATHPQSYYRTGLATPDFPGLARNARQEATGVMHVHFCGAGGNIGAGKYNDGAHENRDVLARRVANGMERAWNEVRKVPIHTADVAWESVNVRLPPGAHLDDEALVARIANKDLPATARIDLASQLAFLRASRAGREHVIGCLRAGPIRVLHMPGELFVEYQLAAQQLRPDLFVAMAAYGEYSPWYIGTKIGYEQGGYETSQGASLVAPEVEGVLVGAMRQLLDAEDVPLAPLGVEAARRETAARRGSAAADAAKSLGMVRQRLRDGEQTRIVCFGDSITGAYYHTGGERAWCDMLGIALEKSYPGAKVQMINAGLSGHTTENALARIDNDVLAHQPHLVVIMFGMNDVTRVPLETYRNNLKTIIEKCRGVGAEIVLCTPNSVYQNDARPNEKLAEYSEAAKQQAAASGIAMLDMFAHWQELREKDDRAWRLLMSDEIHPNMNGHREFAQQMASVISGERFEWKELPAPPAAIPHAIAKLRSGQPLKLVVSKSYETLVQAAVRQYFPDARFEVTVWSDGMPSIAELRKAAEPIRGLQPDLVVVAVPANVTAADEAEFIREYEWVLNFSFPFEGRAWDVLPVLPRVAADDAAASAPYLEAMRSVVVGKDVAFVECPEEDREAAQRILASFLAEANAAAK